jgi:hypothetical protein
MQQYNHDPREGLTFETLETPIDSFKPEDIPEWNVMFGGAEAEEVVRKSRLADVLADEEQIRLNIVDLDALHDQVQTNWQNLYIPSLEELGDHPTACDSAGLASRLRPFQDQLALIQDSKDRLVFICIPAARLRRLEAILALRKVEALVAELAAGLSEARTHQTLAGAYGEEGRLIVLGERSLILKKASEEADRQVILAKEALAEEQKRQLIVAQQRTTAGAITKAEAALSMAQQR